MTIYWLKIWLAVTWVISKRQKSWRSSPRLACKTERRERHGCPLYFSSCPWCKGVYQCPPLTSANARSGRKSNHCSLVCYQDKTSDLGSYLLPFPGRRTSGAIGDRLENGLGGLLMDLQLSPESFLLLADCRPEWKSSAWAFSACEAWCFRQPSTLSSSFFPNIISCQSFLSIFPVFLQLTASHQNLPEK